MKNCTTDNQWTVKLVPLFQGKEKRKKYTSRIKAPSTQAKQIWARLDSFSESNQESEISNSLEKKSKYSES